MFATSRQDTREDNVRTLSVDALERDAAVLLLTDNLNATSAIRWDDWARIAEWVGALPIALDLLNRSLALNSTAPRALFARVDAQHAIATGELDRLRDALRGQVPQNAVHGVTETFSISYDKLDVLAQQIVAACAVEEWDEDQLLAMLQRAYSYRGLTRETYDRVLDMCRTTLNVTGDLTVATYVARSEGYKLLDE